MSEAKLGRLSVEARFDGALISHCEYSERRLRGLAAQDKIFMVDALATPLLQAVKAVGLCVDERKDYESGNGADVLAVAEQIAYVASEASFERELLLNRARQGVPLDASRRRLRSLASYMDDIANMIGDKDE